VFSKERSASIFRKFTVYTKHVSNEIIQVSGNNTRTEQNNENKYSQNKNLYLENLLHFTQSASNEIMEVLVNKIQTKQNQNKDACTYQENLQNNCAKKRHRYKEDL